MVKVQRLFAKTNLKIPVCKAVKNNAEKYNTNIHLGILFCLHTYKCLNIFKININNDAEDVLENTNI